MYIILLFASGLSLSCKALEDRTLSRNGLLTGELLERGVRLHAKSLAVLIEWLQPHLSSLLDDLHRHVQNMVVYVPTPTNLPRDKHNS